MTLIERLEAASGPDRELDVEIARLQNAVVLRRKWDDSGNEEFTHWHYTASIDAALTMVPEGWRPYSADMSVKGRTRFLIEGPKTQWSTDEDGEKCAGNDWYSQGVAATPALALCIAALKAKEADNGKSC